MDSIEMDHVGLLSLATHCESHAAGLASLPTLSISGGSSHLLGRSCRCCAHGGGGAALSAPPENHREWRPLSVIRVNVLPEFYLGDDAVLLTLDGGGVLSD
jgi:hypothetical protein